LCRGSGYALSDLDTWHECPYHCTPTTRHPECDYDDEELHSSNNPAQCLEDENKTPNKEKESKMPEDITNEDMEEMEFKPATPPPPPPLTDDEIPF
jgi:hypothetical protein